MIIFPIILLIIIYIMWNGHKEGIENKPCLVFMIIFCVSLLGTIYWVRS